ncbi:MAG TPA: ABC transporter permease [Vicinamibacterales bacterium]|nr:ABC transporter permease [Vicinamibacterales bacterium]
MSELIYASRSLRKNLGFALVTIGTIALGVGGCTAIFTVVNAVLLRPLPYADSQRLVVLWGELRTRHVTDWPFSPPDLRDLQQQSVELFEGIAGIIPPGRPPIAGAGGVPEQIRVGGATPNLFKVLGAHVVVGRDFEDEDAAPNPQAQPGQTPTLLPAIAIISHGFWLRRFGGDPRVVGTSVDLGAGQAQIVGVLPVDFEMLFSPRANIERVPEMWTATRIDYATANRNNVVFRAIGRLKRGITLEQAQVRVDQIATDLRQHYPAKQSYGLYFHAIPMFDDLVRGVRPVIFSLMGAVAFVLLIACANVANLLVVRAAGRSSELAVRAAIGASRRQLIRQMVAESLVIGGLGTAAGVLMARAGIQVLIALGPKDLPRLENVALDRSALAFAIVAGLTTAISCGIVPALRASRTDVMDVLRSRAGGALGLSGGRRLRGSLVVIEVALSFVLLVGAGLMLRSVLALGRINPGYDPDNVMTFFLQPQAVQPEARAAFLQQVRERLLAIPGVINVTAAGPLPLDGQLASARWGTEEAAADPNAFRQANFHVVSSSYFETMRTPLIAGRTFTEADHKIDQKTDTPKQVIIDDGLAALAFNGASAIGRRLLIRVNSPEPEWYEVVGIVGHQRHVSLAEPGPAAMFVPNGHFGYGFAGHWAVRTVGDPTRLVPAVRAAVAEIDPRSPIAGVQPMQALVDRAMAPLRFTATLIGVFGGVAVLLAAVGLYGVLSTIVRQRTAEIGMRMVFGAPRSSILSLIVGEGLRLSAAGVVVGLLVATAVSRLVAGLLVGVTPNDPLTISGIGVLFAVVVAAASWIPARRASRLDPIVALRDN